MQILNKCHDAYGVLSDNDRRLLEMMLEHPSQEAWQRAKHIVINSSPWITLGMAVSCVTAFREVTTPDPFTVYRALRYALGE